MKYVKILFAFASLLLITAISIADNYYDTGSGSYIQDMGGGNYYDTGRGSFIQNMGGGNYYDTESGGYLQNMGGGY